MFHNTPQRRRGQACTRLESVGAVAGSLWEPRSPCQGAPLPDMTPGQVQELPPPPSTPSPTTPVHATPSRLALVTWILAKGTLKKQQCHGIPRPNLGRGWSPGGSDPKPSWARAPHPSLGVAVTGAVTRAWGPAAPAGVGSSPRPSVRHWGQATPSSGHNLGPGPALWPLCWGLTPLTLSGGPHLRGLWPPLSRPGGGATQMCLPGMQQMPKTCPGSRPRFHR